MKLFVLGAHGKVGQQLIRQLAAKSISATAAVRNADQAKTIKSLGNSSISSQQLTLDAISPQELAGYFKGHDAVVFTAGSAGKNLFQVDLDGAVKTFEACKAANVKRVVVVSAVHADKREFFENHQLRDYYLAKHYADRILISEFKSLDYTILKPTYLTDDEGVGKISLISSDDTDIGNIGSVSRADVALVVISVLDKKVTFGRSYDFKTGTKDIYDELTYA